MAYSAKNADTVATFARQNAILLLFALLAVAVRLAYWAYTDRTWEDALIALTSARNVWDGSGLTHHASEPRVHSFTSALGQLVLIAGEAFRQGLLTMRVVSIAAAAASICFAYQIGRKLDFPWPAHVLLLGYLALDHLQIFFGMGGLETQIAVALALATVHSYLNGRWISLGVATGLALICRPEFLLWGAILTVVLLIWHRAAIVKVALPTLAIITPWLVLATIYYGSPVPFTVIVKSSKAGVSVPGSISYLLSSWKTHAPFKQYWFVTETPLPDVALQAIVLALFALGAAGIIWSLHRERRLLPAALFLIGFLAYRVIFRVDTYFMWYLPPFVALLFLFAAVGVAALFKRSRALAIVLATLVFLAYTIHLPLTFELDRRVQAGIEVAVRTKVGERLNELMGPSDTVVLEPLGFVGWAARNKTIYDVPGLGSPIAFGAFMKRRSLGGVIDELDPTFLALRPREWDGVARNEPNVAARYRALETVQAAPEHLESHSFGGLTYFTIDAVFTIYRRLT